jgi:hypothetical protein
MFVRAAVLLPAIAVSLRIRGFRATQAALQNFSIAPKIEKSVDAGERVELASRMVNAAARHGWKRATCLERSLALWWLLRREGITSSVRIGARKASGKFEAHAWVEWGGAALNEPGDGHRHYAAFDAEFPSQPAETS